MGDGGDSGLKENFMNQNLSNNSKSRNSNLSGFINNMRDSTKGDEVYPRSTSKLGKSSKNDLLELEELASNNNNSLKVKSPDANFFPKSPMLKKGLMKKKEEENDGFEELEEIKVVKIADKATPVEKIVSPYSKVDSITNRKSSEEKNKLTPIIVNKRQSTDEDEYKFEEEDLKEDDFTEEELLEQVAEKKDEGILSFIFPCYN